MSELKQQDGVTQVAFAVAFLTLVFGVDKPVLPATARQKSTDFAAEHSSTSFVCYTD